MKKPFPILILTFLALVNEISSQDFSFTYDVSGNRINRSIILGKSTSSQIVSDSAKIQQSVEALGNVQIILYPNPTKDDVYIDILSTDEVISSSLSIFDYSGRLMKTISDLNGISKAGISGFPPGNYFLLIKVNDKTSQWQIIKEK